MDGGVRTGCLTGWRPAGLAVLGDGGRWQGQVFHGRNGAGGPRRCEAGDPTRSGLAVLGGRGGAGRAALHAGKGASASPRSASRQRASDVRILSLHTCLRPRFLFGSEMWQTQCLRHLTS